MNNEFNNLSIKDIKGVIGSTESIISEYEQKIKEEIEVMSNSNFSITLIKSSNNRISKNLESIDEYNNILKLLHEALTRAERIEKGHNTIVEFLEYMLEQDIKWYEELRKEYLEKGYKEFVKMYNISKSDLVFAKMSKEEAVRNFKIDLEIRYNKLVATVEKKVGQIKSVEVYRNNNEGFDGEVTGENGKCRLTTFIAGGYNIQRLHYRTICK